MKLNEIKIMPSGKGYVIRLGEHSFLKTGKGFGSKAQVRFWKTFKGVENYFKKHYINR